MGFRALAALAAASLAFWTCDKPTPVAPAEAVLSISANPTRIEIDGVAVITVIARKSDGNPVNPGTEINFSTTLGQIDEVVPTDDRGTARSNLSGTGEAGIATVTASSGAAVAETIDVAIGSLAGSMTLQPNPTTLPKEGGTVTLVATVFDVNGNRLRNHAVSFGSDVGTLASGGSGIDTDSRGEARDTLTVTSFEAQRVEEGVFEVRASTVTEGGDLLEEIADVSIGGFPASLSLSVNPSTITRDGGVLSLRAIVRDDGSEPAEGAEVNFLSELGSLASGGATLLTDAGGQVSDTLTVTTAEAEAGGTSFLVEAEVTGAAGEVVRDEATVTITGTVGGLQANFTFTISGLTVTFTETSTGGQGVKTMWTFLWEFGDGTTSTVQNPIKTYDSTGDYLVTLTARDTVGEEGVISRQVSIPKTPANADFDWEAAETTFDGKVEFDGSMSTGQGDLSFSWEIEGGGFGPESQAEVFVYDFGTLTGEFEVTLTVTDEEGDTDSLTRFVNLDALN